MGLVHFLEVAEDLEMAGLLWQPEIGDEVSDRRRRESVSILVDPQGMTPTELRSSYLWLPTVEQLVLQLEVRQAILFHTGLELTERSLGYKTIVRAPTSQIEVIAESMRSSLGMALRNLLLKDKTDQIN